MPPLPPCWGHCSIREECGAFVPSFFFQLPPKVGAGEPLRSTDRCLCSRFQKFRELVWDVNHASGLEKIAESKPREVWGRLDGAADLGPILEAGQLQSLSALLGDSQPTSPRNRGPATNALKPRTQPLPPGSTVPNNFQGCPKTPRIELLLKQAHKIPAVNYHIKHSGCW